MLALKILFGIFGILYILSVILHKNYISKLKDNVRISNFVAFIAFLLIGYIVLGLILFVLLKGIIYKILILFFAMSPFIIGKIATYKKEKVFTFIQHILIIVSIFFVFLS